MEEEPLVGNPAELSSQIKQLLKDSIPPETISTTLRQNGFTTKSSRKGGGDPKYRYELPKAKLEEIIERYATEDLPSPDYVPRQTERVDSAPSKSNAEDVVDVVGNTEEIEVIKI